MGFAAEYVKEALKRCHGDVEKGIDMLVSNQGVLPPVSQSTEGKNIVWLVACTSPTNSTHEGLVQSLQLKPL